MQMLIYGGSGSGKSALAEQLCQHLAASGPPLYYIATMWPQGADAKARIARHQKARSGKGFTTVEQYTNLAALKLPQGAVVLLECLGNWVANEIFAGGGAGPAGAEEAVRQALAHLNSRAAHLVVVSNEVGADGVAYPEETLAYQRTLAALNRHLAAQSGLVAETVCGIPLVHKGEFPCPY